MTQQKSNSSRVQTIIIVVIFLTIVALVVALVMQQMPQDKQLGASEVTQSELYQAVEAVLVYYHVPSRKPGKISTLQSEAKKIDLQTAREQLRPSFQILMEYKDHKDLQREKDQAIFALISSRSVDYWLTQFDLASPNARDTLSLAYTCSTNRFALGTYEVAPVVQAVHLYHEFSHAVDCKAIMRHLQIIEHSGMHDIELHINRCDLEAPAYAAQSRLFKQLMLDGRFHDVTIPMAEQKGDDVQSLLDGWTAIMKGKTAFCEYLASVYASHGYRMFE